MKKITLFVAATLSLFAANIIQDKDMDGVIDSIDKCPNTPFFDIVDETGCSIKHIVVSKKIEMQTIKKEK